MNNVYSGNSREKKITLNDDDDSGGSQFQLFGNVFPFQNLLLNKFICVKFTHAFLLCSLH